MSKDTFTKTYKTSNIRRFDKYVDKFFEPEDKVITSVIFGEGTVTFKGFVIDKKEEEKQDA